MGFYHPSGERKDGTAIGSEAHWRDLQQRAEKRMARIDTLPADIRELIHEYGWDGVKELLDLGVKRASHMRHIIKAIRGEAK